MVLPLTLAAIAVSCRTAPDRERPRGQTTSAQREARQAMPQARLDEVLARHTHALLAIPGVIGTGEGEEDGRPVFLVLVDRATPELRARLPASLEGYPVVIRETGKVKALDRR